MTLIGIDISMSSLAAGGGLPVSGAFVDYAMGDTRFRTTSSGDVATISDRTGNLDDLVPLGNAPSAETGYISFAGSNNEGLQYSGSASDFNGRHNDSGDWTEFIVFRSSSAATQIVISNMNQTGFPNSVGQRLQYNNGSNAGDVVFFVGNGSASVETGASSATQSGLCPSGEVNIVSYAKTSSSMANYPIMSYANGRIYEADPENNTPTDSDGQKLTFGRMPDSTSADLTGDIFHYTAFNRRLSQNEIIAMEKYFEQEYGIASYNDKPETTLTFLSGQSNAAGADTIANASNFTNPEVITNSEIFATTPAFNDLEIGVNNRTGNTDNPLLIGSEGGLMQEIVTRQPASRDEHLVKYAVGGTSIAEFLTGGLYGSIIQARIYQAIERLEADNYKFPVYFLWWQGENDAGDEAEANAYLGNLETLVSQLQGAARGNTFNKICIVKIQGNPEETGYPFQTEVNNAQAEFCNDRPNSLLLDRTVTFIEGDNDHATADSCEQFGRDAAAWFIDSEVRYTA